MKFDSYPQSKFSQHDICNKKSIFIKACNYPDTKPTIMEFLRFEEKKELFVWAHADEICFVKSADHYVRSLIKCGELFKWMTRHSTIKELHDVLSDDNFIRLNKFYLLNLDFFSHINETGKIIFLKDNFSIPVTHRISPFMLHLLKNNHT
jgi:DNA-binding LytR/AlgR family response regulator